MKHYRVCINGNNFGSYEAEDEATALDAYAKDAGYDNYEDVPKGDHDMIEITAVEPDGEIYGDLNDDGIVVYIEYGDVYIADAQNSENAPATKENVEKYLKQAVEIQLTWARENGDYEKCKEIKERTKDLF